MADIQTQVDTIITTLQGYAQDALDEAKDASDTAMAASQGVASPGSVPFVNAPKVPDAPLPPGGTADAQTALTKADIDDYWNRISAWLNGLKTDWINAYFPKCSDGTEVAQEGYNWLCDTLSGGIGIPKSIEIGIWNRSRERALKELRRAEDEAYTSLAARGFSMPTGTLNAQIARLQQETANANAVSAREVAIQNLTIQIDAIKFAAGQAVPLRAQFLTALDNYLGEYMRVPLGALDAGLRFSNARAQIYAAMGEYYRLLLGGAELQLRAQIAQGDFQLRFNSEYVNAWTSSIENQAKTALGVATAMGNHAAAAANSLNAIANVSANEQLTSA